MLDSKDQREFWMRCVERSIARSDAISAVVDADECLLAFRWRFDRANMTPDEISMVEAACLETTMEKWERGDDGDGS